MTPYQLGQLFVRVNRHHDEGAKVYDFARTLVIPDECVAAFLEATAEPPNLADRQADAPVPDRWLRIAKQVADMIGLEVAEPRERIRAARPGRVPW